MPNINIELTSVMCYHIGSNLMPIRMIRIVTYFWCTFVFIDE